MMLSHDSILIKRRNQISHQTMLIKKHIKSLITKQLSYQVVRDLKTQSFAFPGLKKLEKEIVLPIIDITSDAPTLTKDTQQGSEGVAFINYMSSTSDQFKKIVEKILEFEDKVISQAGQVVVPKLKNTKEAALELLASVVKKIHSSENTARQNYDTILVCILFFSSKFNGLGVEIFFQVMQTCDKWKTLSLEKMKKWKSFRLVGSISELA